MASRDDAAYVDFVSTVQDRLRRTAYLLTGDWTTAADVTQDALIKVYVAWPRIERGGGLAAYARRAVVSTVIDHQRKWKRRPEEAREDMDVLVVADGASARAERAALMQALAAIPDRQRACIVLRYFEDLSVADTADALRCSAGNVKSQTSHGLRALRRELDRVGLADLETADLGGVA